MKYLFVLWSDESLMEGLSQEEMVAGMAKWNDCTEGMKEAGVWVAGEGLAPTSSATTISVQDGQRIVSDGPFAETTEQIAGFYLVEAADLDAALKWAETVPTVHFGKIEVRPIMDYPEAP